MLKDCFFRADMFVSISFFLLFQTLLDQNSILAKAAEKGFFYRNVEISEIEKCPEKALCINHSDKNYLIKKKDGFSVKDEITNKSISIEITPENKYISYFLYIQHSSGIHKIQLNRKKIIIDNGVPNIIKIQIVGTGPNGPVVIWEKSLKNVPPFLFSNSFDESIRKIRKAYFLKPLKLSKELESAATETLKRLKSEGLVHYSAKTGSIRHTGINKSVLGENLFIAENEEKGWEMLIKSPSHLYNLLNSQFKKYFYASVKIDGSLYGAIVFSE